MRNGAVFLRCLILQFFAIRNGFEREIRRCSKPFESPLGRELFLCERIWTRAEQGTDKYWALLGY